MVQLQRITRLVYIPSRGFAKKKNASSSIFAKVDQETNAQQPKQTVKRRSDDAETKAKDTRTKALMEANEERLRKFYSQIVTGLDRRTPEEILKDWTIERRLNQLRLKSHVEMAHRFTLQIRRQWEAHHALPAFLQKRCSQPERRAPPRFPMEYDPWGNPTMSPEPRLFGGKSLTQKMVRQEERETKKRMEYYYRNNQPPDDDRENVPKIPLFTVEKGPGNVMYLTRHRFPNNTTKEEYFGGQLPKVRRAPTQHVQ